MTTPTMTAAARAVDLFKQYGQEDTAVTALDHVDVEFARKDRKSVV